MCSDDVATVLGREVQSLMKSSLWWGERVQVKRVGYDVIKGNHTVSTMEFKTPQSYCCKTSSTRFIESKRTVVLWCVLRLVSWQGAWSGKRLVPREFPRPKFLRAITVLVLFQVIQSRPPRGV